MRSMRVRCLLASALCAASLTAPAPASAELPCTAGAPAGGEWASYGRDLSNSRHQPAETVISGLVHEDEQLHELLSVLQSLGLHVVSVQQVVP